MRDSTPLTPEHAATSSDATGEMSDTELESVSGGDGADWVRDNVLVPAAVKVATAVEWVVDQVSPPTRD